MSRVPHCSDNEVLLTDIPLQEMYKKGGDIYKISKLLEH